MSIATRLGELENDISNAYDAIEYKGGVLSGVNKNTHNLSDCIYSIPNNSERPYPIIEGTGKHEVRFFDHTGTIIKKQYVDDGENATYPTTAQMPVYEGLTFDGWTKNTINGVHRDIEVGAIYKPTDGNVHIFHTVNAENGYTKTLNLTSYVSTANNCQIDWGDGSAVTTLGTGTGRKYATHTYTDGDYEIIITKTAGTGKYTLGNGTSNSATGSITTTIFGNAYNSPKINSGIKKIWLNTDFVGFQVYSIAFADNLTEIVMPNLTYTSYKCLFGATKLRAFVAEGRDTTHYSIYTGAIGSNGLRMVAPYYVNRNDTWRLSMMAVVFQACGELEKFCYPEYDDVYSGTSLQTSFSSECYCAGIAKYEFPKNLPSTVGGSFFAYDQSIREVEIPEGVTTIGINFFYFCKGLQKVTIPSTCTSINNQTFFQCENLMEIHFKSTTPPTAGSTTVWTAIPTACKIYVPSASLNAYKTATNYTGQASKMVGE